MSYSFRLKSSSSLPQTVLYKISTDIANFDKVMPDHFRSIDIIESSANMITTKEHIVFLHIPITVKAYHKVVPPDVHKVRIASGPFSGTQFVEYYTSAHTGTIVTIDVSLPRYLQLFKPIRYLVYRVMSSTLEQFIVSAEMYKSKI